MRDILLKIPSDITNHIKDFLWGNMAYWKVKLNQIINNRNLIVNLNDHLNTSGDYYKIYCPQCGEKELFPFPHPQTVCFYCDTDIYKYPFNTFSGSNQGCFYLHNIYIMLYRGIEKHKNYYPNHARCWGTAQWRHKRYIYID